MGSSIVTFLILIAYGVGYLVSHTIRSRREEELENTIKFLTEFKPEGDTIISFPVNDKKEVWPRSPEDYLRFHSIEPEGGEITILYKGLENLIKGYAQHKVTQKKREIFDDLKIVKGGRQIMKKHK